MLDEKDITPQDARLLDELRRRYGIWALRAYFTTGERLADRRRSALLGDPAAIEHEVLRSLDSVMTQ